jgi:hypothetical protein
MTQTIVIGETEFERARKAFVKAWEEQDRLLETLNINGERGTRTRAGLKAALAEIGIKVDA